MPALEVPASSLHEADAWYSYGRCWSYFGHWFCDLADVPPKFPGSCGMGEYREPGEAKATGSLTSDTATARASVIKADVLEAWRQLGTSSSPHYTIGLARMIPAVLYIGPRPWAENDEEWYERRLDWFVLHRWRFGPLPAERYLALTDDAVRHVSWILGWRP